MAGRITFWSASEAPPSSPRPTPPRAAAAPPSSLVSPPPHKPGRFLRSLVAEERTVKGSYMGSCVPRRDVPRLIAMHQAGLLPVESLHSHTVKLEQINE